MTAKGNVQEIGSLITNFQEEIKNLRGQLENLPSFPKGDVPPQLARLQNKLGVFENKMKEMSQNLVKNDMQNFGDTIQPLSNVKLPAIMKWHKTAMGSSPKGASEVSKPVSKILKKERERALTTNPQSDIGKKILREKFELPPPVQSKTRALGKMSLVGKIFSSKTTKPQRILNKEQRLDPFSEPPPITENDIGQGIMNLVNRGIIPKDVDLTPAFVRGAPPFTLKPAKMYAKTESNMKQEVQTGVPTFMTSIKYDFQQYEPPMRMIKMPSKTQEMASINVEQRLALPPSDSQISTLRQKTPDEKDKNANPRTYHELLDEYSLHQFIIRKGKTVDTTPEFTSFKRTHLPNWGQIAYLVHLLEKLLTENSVPFAYIDGKKLARLAMEEKQKPTKEDLLNCIVNQDQVEEYVKVPARMFRGPNGRELAAVVVQKNWRRYQAYTEYNRTRFFKNKVQVIWRAFQLYKLKMRTRQTIEQRFRENLYVWREMMSEFKRKWPEIKRKKRVEIHINSFSFSEMKRLSMEKFLQRENSQISRLFAVKNPLVDVIYICPFQLTSEIIGYYSKVLEIGEIDNPNSRFTIVVPENYDRFPTHYAASSAMLYSPKALKRIKTLIKGKQAYIVPGNVSSDDVKLSISLGIPIMSGEPQKNQLYSTKSGSRRIFNLADVPIPIGAYDIYDQNEFEITLTKLILNHPHINSWVFKIDDEFSGRGHASFSIENIKSLKELRKKKPEVTEALIERIQERIHKELPKRARIAMPSLYPNWAEYMAAFCRVGGVIEAAPNCPTSQMHAPSVAFCIEPDGGIQVIGSFDRFQSKEFINAGCSFPQTSLPNMNLVTISKAIGDVLYEKGVIGHVTVDLLAFPFPQNPSSHPLFWGIDLNCHMTDYSSVIYFFDFLMEGKLDQPTGHYSIQAFQEEGYKKDDNEHTEPRSFMYCKYLNHPGLMSIQYKTFFHMCRLESISFDLEKRMGSTFLLSDCLQSGVIAVITIGEDKKESLKSMKEAMHFIQQHAGDAPQKRGMLDDARADEMNVNEVMSKIRMMFNTMEKKSKKGIMSDAPNKASFMSEMI